MNENQENMNTVSEPKGNGMNWAMVIVAVVLVIGAAAYFMSRNNAKNDAMMTGTQPTATQTDSMMTDDQGVPIEDVSDSVVEVEGGSFYFEPNRIVVKKGETVKIVLNSVDMMHDFVIDELGVQSPIVQAGGTAEIEFTAEEAGEFEYYCSVGNHRAQGMVGTLVVEE